MKIYKYINSTNITIQNSIGKKALCSSLLFVILTFSCSSPPLADQVLNQSEAQYRDMLEKLSNSDSFPRTTNSVGTIQMVAPKDWTSGFFPGALWYLSEYSKDIYWQQQAEKYTEMLENEQYNGRDHDIGFKMFCSYGNGYRLTKNPKYKNILIQSAKTLATRYNPSTGCIRSWDRWTYPVIIDNLMNLELLFWVARETNDENFYNIAFSHAMTTLKNHFRADYSSYHVVEFDTLTGGVIEKKTHQGYSDDSSWARGQGWALYGMTMTFRETQDSVFLKQALGIADYIMKNEVMQNEGVPYWDFDDPAIPDAPRDASAAAIICSALYELAGYAPEQQKKKMLKFADNIFEHLASDEYMSEIDSNNNFLLKHGTGFKPKNKEVDEPLIYADYYFLEAAIRRHNLLKESVFKTANIQ